MAWAGKGFSPFSLSLFFKAISGYTCKRPWTDGAARVLGNTGAETGRPLLERSVKVVERTKWRNCFEVSWDQCSQNRLPSAVAIATTDRPNAGFKTIYVMAVGIVVRVPRPKPVVRTAKVTPGVDAVSRRSLVPTRSGRQAKCAVA